MPVSKAKQKAVAKYVQKNYDDIKLRVKKGDREKYRAAAEARGESMTQFFIRAAEERIKNTE